MYHFCNKEIKTSKGIVWKPRINLCHMPWTFMRNSMACDALNAQHVNYSETLKAFWVLSSPPMQINNITISACMTLLVARLVSPSRLPEANHSNSARVLSSVHAPSLQLQACTHTMTWGKSKLIPLIDYSAYSLRDDHIDYSSSPSTKIHGWCDQAFKASVSLKNLLHAGNGRVVWHSLIENLDEYWIHAKVFKYSHSMGLVEWNASFKNCILRREGWEGT